MYDDLLSRLVMASSGAVWGPYLAVEATAQRLAAECKRAHTRALLAATTPQGFTVRQRENISIAAQGLSNKEIADRLTMSIRSAEGHLFRTSQRVRANNANS